MPMPIGVWKANINGTETDLVLESPNQQGAFSGKLFDTEVKGFWDEASQSVMFQITLIFENRFADFAVFRGYLFRPPNAEPGRDVVATLTGAVQVGVGTGPATFPVAIATARRNVFGWFAHITEIS